MRKLVQNSDLDGSEFSLLGKNETCVILIHGFTATTVEVRPLAEYFSENGYSVFAPLLPGHNTNPDDLNERTWQEWVNAAEAVTVEALSKFKNVFIGGESMGGLIACYIASFYPEITGLLLYSPAIHVKKLEFMRIFKFFTKFIAKPSLKLEDEEIQDVLPWKGYKVNPTRAAVQLLNLQKEVKNRLDYIRHPTIIFQGKLDKTIDQSGATYIYNKIQSVKKNLIWLEQSNHCVILDKEYPYIFTESLKFVEKVTSKID